VSIDDAPPLLGVRGGGDADAADDRHRGLAQCVGRRAQFASALAHELGEAGFVVISGLARGIDQAAHRASVASGTVAVLAGGHDRIYPPEHEDLLAGILDAKGARRQGCPTPRVPRFPKCRSVTSHGRAIFLGAIA
jgi:DNA processing protein